MSNAPLPPGLPTYAPPKERVPATIPTGLENLTKPHGIMNKLIGRMLPKSGKGRQMKASLKLMSLKKIPNPFPKAKKKKVL
jgi:ribosomal protein L13